MALELFELNPAGLLLHEYLLPGTAVLPIAAQEPKQIFDDEPAFAAGRGLMVSITIFTLLHPVLFFVSISV